MIAPWVPCSRSRQRDNGPRRTSPASARPARAFARHSPPTATKAFVIWWRCEETCLRAAPGRANSATPTNSWRIIRAETGDWFHIDVACYPEYHPQSTSPAADLASFKRKVDAGANSSITQYFFNADSYYRFVDAATAAGVTVPIVPGVMPITSFSKLARFSDACGAEIPRWIRRKMESFGDDASSVRAFGLDVVTDLCADLLEHGAPGLHFYTLNQANLTTVIWQRLGL